MTGEEIQEGKECFDAMRFFFKKVNNMHLWWSIEKHIFHYGAQETLTDFEVESRFTPQQIEISIKAFHYVEYIQKLGSKLN